MSLNWPRGPGSGVTGGSAPSVVLLGRIRFCEAAFGLMARISLCRWREMPAMWHPSGERTCSVSEKACGETSLALAAS